MLLTDTDQAFLHGEAGEATRVAMELLVAIAEAEGAPQLLDISAAHIDGGLYHGQAGLDFARSLVDGGGRVAVPTTLNVSSLDLLHPDLYRGDAGVARAARELMDAYLEMGCAPSWTCAPYQLPDRPAIGEQIAWGESNAIVFANSVLGARTARYGDFLDICCALTGRAPKIGLHTDEGRRATLRVDLDLPDGLLHDDLMYPVLGHVLGQVAGTDIPVIVGLDERATEDRLKALGAAAASTGAVGMFHAVGVTPEATTVEDATGGLPPERTIVVGVGDLVSARASLSAGAGRLGAVSVGTPHFSIAELNALARLVEGRSTIVPFFVNTSRHDIGEAEKSGSLAIIESFGATLVTDTCTYITPIMGDVRGVVMTNSGKWAFYAPANLGVDVVLAGLADCVASAVSGDITMSADW
ncbi:MAG: aconitase X [Acidimicrobiia bacterium]